MPKSERKGSSSKGTSPETLNEQHEENKETSSNNKKRSFFNDSSSASEDNQDNWFFTVTDSESSDSGIGPKEKRKQDPNVQEKSTKGSESSKLDTRKKKALQKNGPNGRVQQDDMINDSKSDINTENKNTKLENEAQGSMQKENLINYSESSFSIANKDEAKNQNKRQGNVEIDGWDFFSKLLIDSDSESSSASGYLDKLDKMVKGSSNEAHNDATGSTVKVDNDEKSTASSLKQHESSSSNGMNEVTEKEKDAIKLETPLTGSEVFKS